MSGAERPTAGLRGAYRDVLRDPRGQVVWERGWRSNAIVGDCRRLLASFMRGTPTANGLIGLQVGVGSDGWDASGTPASTSAQVKLVDPNPYLLDASKLQISFLDGSTITSTPTNKLQIQANLGAQMPNWPDGNHPTGNLREFGLVARLDGATVLINYVTHPIIAKDPASTLERTIWLTF